MGGEIADLPNDVDALKAALTVERAKMREVVAERDASAAELAVARAKARAIAMLFAGLTLANVLGVPLGTALGEALGWRQTFWAVVVIGVVAAAALNAWLPRDNPAPRVRLTQEARSLGRTKVILAMLVRDAATARSAAAAPSLQRQHDRHRDLRPVAPAPRAAAVGCGNRGCSVLTRHGMRSPNAATLLPRPTEPHAFYLKAIASEPNFAAGQHSTRRSHGAISYSPLVSRRLPCPAAATLPHCKNPKSP